LKGAYPILGVIFKKINPNYVETMSGLRSSDANIVEKRPPMGFMPINYGIYGLVFDLSFFS